MVRIAICDDEKEAVILHEGIVKRSLHACGIGYEIMPYTQSGNLLSDIADDGFFFDLILLDIEMPGLSGMELTKKISAYLPNVMVIFITSHIAKVRKSLQHIFEELNAPEFIFIDRGCIVNIIHIMKINTSMAYLKNGVALPISRSHLQEVKQKINHFWGTHI